MMSGVTRVSRPNSRRSQGFGSRRPRGEAGNPRALSGTSSCSFRAYGRKPGGVCLPRRPQTRDRAFLGGLSIPPHLRRFPKQGQGGKKSEEPGPDAGLRHASSHQLPCDLMVAGCQFHQGSPRGQENSHLCFPGLPAWFKGQVLAFSGAHAGQTVKIHPGTGSSACLCATHYTHPETLLKQAANQTHTQQIQMDGTTELADGSNGDARGS